MYVIRRLSSKDNSEKEQFLKLMEISFDEKKTADWFEWKYFKNPLCKDSGPIVFGAYINETNELIGIRPFIPSYVKGRSCLYKAAQPCDTVVHPDHRNNGLFTKMNKVAINELKEHGFHFFYNFPNFNSQPGYLKLGWQIVFKVDESFSFEKFGKVVKNKTNNPIYSLAGGAMSLGIKKPNSIMKKLSKLIEGNGGYIQKEHDFTDEYEKLWDLKDNERYRVKRDKQYLDWRFKQRPDKEYEIWTKREKGVLDAYATVTASMRWNSLEAQIVDFQYKKQSDFLQLLKAIVQDCYTNKNCDFISILAATDNEIFIKLRKLGFIHRSSFPYKYAIPQRNFLVKVLDTTLEDDILQSYNWIIRSSDQDTY